MMLTITNKNSAKHTTIPPTAAPDKTGAPIEKPASVFIIVVVSKCLGVDVSWFNVPLVCSILMGK